MTAAHPSNGATPLVILSLQGVKNPRYLTADQFDEARLFQVVLLIRKARGQIAQPSEARQTIPGFPPFSSESGMPKIPINQRGECLGGESTPGDSVLFTSAAAYDSPVGAEKEETSLRNLDANENARLLTGQDLPNRKTRP